MLCSSMIIKRKYPSLPLPTLRKVNCRMHKLILFRLRFNNDVAVRVYNDRTANKRPMIFYASFGSVNTEARVLVAPSLAGKAMVV
jgi:hypothetical protein